MIFPALGFTQGSVIACHSVDGGDDCFRYVEGGGRYPMQMEATM